MPTLLQRSIMRGLICLLGALALLQPCYRPPCMNCDGEGAVSFETKTEVARSSEAACGCCRRERSPLPGNAEIAVPKGCDCPSQCACRRIPDCAVVIRQPVEDASPCNFRHDDQQEFRRAVSVARRTGRCRAFAAAPFSVSRCALLCRFQI